MADKTLSLVIPFDLRARREAIRGQSIIPRIVVDATLQNQLSLSPFVDFPRMGRSSTIGQVSVIYPFIQRPLDSGHTIHHINLRENFPEIYLVPERVPRSSYVPSVSPVPSAPLLPPNASEVVDSFVEFNRRMLSENRAKLRELKEDEQKTGIDNTEEQNKLRATIKEIQEEIEPIAEGIEKRFNEPLTHREMFPEPPTDQEYFYQTDAAEFNEPLPFGLWQDLKNFFIHLQFDKRPDREFDVGHVTVIDSSEIEIDEEETKRAKETAEKAAAEGIPVPPRKKRKNLLRRDAISIVGFGPRDCPSLSGSIFISRGRSNKKFQARMESKSLEEIQAIPNSQKIMGSYFKVRNTDSVLHAQYIAQALIRCIQMNNVWGTIWDDTDNLWSLYEVNYTNPLYPNAKLGKLRTFPLLNFHDHPSSQSMLGFMI